MGAVRWIDPRGLQYTTPHYTIHTLYLYTQYIRQKNLRTTYWERISAVQHETGVYIARLYTNTKRRPAIELIKTCEDVCCELQSRTVWCKTYWQKTVYEGSSPGRVVWLSMVSEVLLEALQSIYSWEVPYSRSSPLRHLR